MLKDLKCPLCKNQVSCSIMGISEDAIKGCGMFNLIDPPKRPQTNADRIRAMTDEELAEWYWWMLKYVQGYTDSRCALLDWLKQEAET